MRGSVLWAVLPDINEDWLTDQWMHPQLHKSSRALDFYADSVMLR